MPKTPWTDEAAWGARGGVTGRTAVVATGAAGAGWRDDRVVETVCWMKGVSWEMILATCGENILFYFLQGTLTKGIEVACFAK